MLRIIVVLFVCFLLRPAEANDKGRNEGLLFRSAAYPGLNPAGYDLDGKLDLWIPIADIEIGESTRKIWIQFAPEPGAGLLPGGWTFPLVDSRAYRLDDATILVALPDGKTRQFVQRSDGKIAPSGDWYCTLDGETLTLKTGFETLSFEKGKVKKWRRTDGVGLEWHYDKNFDLTKITDEGGNPVLRLNKTGAGVEKTYHCHFADDSNPVEILTTETPMVDFENAYGPGFGFVANQLIAIRFADGKKIDIDCASENGIHSLYFSGVKPFDDIGLRAWNAATGEIVQSGEKMIRLFREDAESELPAIIELVDGKETLIRPEESFENGIRTIRYPDGTRIEEHYLWGTKAGRVLRKRVEFGTLDDRDGNGFVALRAWYDNDGNIIRLENRGNVENFSPNQKTTNEN